MADEEDVEQLAGSDAVFQEYSDSLATQRRQFLKTSPVISSVQKRKAFRSLGVISKGSQMQ